MRGAHGLLAHGGGVGDEAVVNLILNDERLYRLCAGDALVEVAGYFRVYLAYLAVDADKPALEHREQQHDDRHYRQHHKRELRVYGEHDGYRADEVGHLPYAVDERP